VQGFNRFRWAWQYQQYSIVGTYIVGGRWHAILFVWTMERISFIEEEDDMICCFVVGSSHRRDTVRMQRLLSKSTLRVRSRHEREPKGEARAFPDGACAGYLEVLLTLSLGSSLIR